MSVKDILFSLCCAPDTGDAPESASNAAKSLLQQYARVSFDAMGNIIGEIEGKGRHFLLDAHIDEIGFVVTSIEDGGFVKTGKYGGIDIRTLAASEVVIWGREPVYGVFTACAPHLAKDGDGKKAQPLEELAIDTGIDTEELKKLVSQGDRVTFKASPAMLLNDCVTCKSLDDRAGVAAILRALELLSQTSCDAKITVLFSVQEEVGTRGAAIGAYGRGCDEAIAVDVSFALQPGALAHKCGKLGEGPMIGISPVLFKNGWSKLKKIAQERNIPSQVEVMAGETGTNADVITLTQGGIPTSLISIPLRNMHTPSEVVSMADIENTAALIASYISSSCERTV